MKGWVDLGFSYTWWSMISSTPSHFLLYSLVAHYLYKHPLSPLFEIISSWSFSPCDRAYTLTSSVWNSCSTLHIFHLLISVKKMTMTIRVCSKIWQKKVSSQATRPTGIKQLCSVCWLIKTSMLTTTIWQSPVRRGADPLTFDASSTVCM